MCCVPQGRISAARAEQAAIRRPCPGFMAGLMRQRYFSATFGEMADGDDVIRPGKISSELAEALGKRKPSTRQHLLDHGGAWKHFPYIQAYNRLACRLMLPAAWSHSQVSHLLSCRQQTVLLVNIYCILHICPQTEFCVSSCRDEQQPATSTMVEQDGSAGCATQIPGIIRPWLDRSRRSHVLHQWQ